MLELGNAVLRVIPFALGVAVSPLPIVAVLVILLTERARIGGLVFATAWVLGNAAAIAIAIVFAGHIRHPSHGLDLPWEGAVIALLGVGLVVTAWLSRRGRLLAHDSAARPNWVAAVDNLSPLGGALVAFSNAMTSPKNLALAIGAGTAIRSTTPLPADQSFAALVYVLIASCTVALPVAIYFIAGVRAKPVLTRWKGYLTARAAVIMEVTLFVFGIGLAFKGLYNLFT